MFLRRLTTFRAIIKSETHISWLRHWAKSVKWIEALQLCISRQIRCFGMYRRNNMMAQKTSNRLWGFNWKICFVHLMHGADPHELNMIPVRKHIEPKEYRVGLYQSEDISYSFRGTRIFKDGMSNILIYFWWCFLVMYYTVYNWKCD